jgi:hypothetical protein
MMKTAHIYITQYSRNKALKHQKTGTHRFLRRHNNKKLKILWDQGIKPDREILTNMLETVVEKMQIKCSYW